MNKAPAKSSDTYKNRVRRLESRWQELCARFLSLSKKDSVWRYHRVRDASEPEQGWKLHISATVLNAGKTLERIGPFLAARGVQFKAPRSLREVIRINSGIIYGYSQVGKVFTVYPRTPEESVLLAKALHRLTRRMRAPVIAFDQRYSPASNVYYRFGAFSPLEMVDANGHRRPAIRNPLGELIPDLRESENVAPAGVSNPFRKVGSEQSSPAVSQAKNFRVLRALVQRGKGGVYQAVDFNVNPPRLCLLKEGRKNGEVNCDGRDGYWRVRNEERVLRLLAASGVDVPAVYASFEVEDNYYLVTEFIEGDCLHHKLRKLRRRMPLSRILHYGIQLAGIFAQMHSAGWVWRDCKPMNLMITPGGELRPLDFEGTCPVDRPDTMLWGTPGFTPPEWRDLKLQSGVHSDLYALGSMLYLLLTGRVPDATAPIPIEKLRPHVPSTLSQLIMRLLSHLPERRYPARVVAHKLKEIRSLLRGAGEVTACKGQKTRRKAAKSKEASTLKRPQDLSVTAIVVREG